MRLKSKTLGLAGVLAAVAMLVMAVGASAASAVEFHYTGATPTKLLGEATSSQVFKTSLGTITCKKLSIPNNKIEKPAAPSQLATIDYTECSAETLLGSSEVKEPVVAPYNFLATGTVEVVKPIDIELTSLGCTITVGEQTLPKAVSYGARGTKLPVEAHAEGIAWEGCLSSGSEGTYTGNSLVFGESGGELYVE